MATRGKRWGSLAFAAFLVWVIVVTARRAEVSVQVRAGFILVQSAMLVLALHEWNGRPEWTRKVLVVTAVMGVSGIAVALLGLTGE
jgi:hypothetical protein